MLVGNWISFTTLKAKVGVNHIASYPQVTLAGAGSSMNEHVWDLFFQFTL